MARAFPKCLFQSDPVATMNVFRVLKKKGIVSIFPEGQISPIGVTQTFNLAIGKILKKAKVDVYIVKHHFAYLVNPPWSKKTFRGRVETTVELMVSKELIETISEAKLNDLIREKLAYNTFEHNQAKQFQFHLNDIHNLESVIYQCPKCHDKGLTSSKTALICGNCGSEFVYDKHGLIGGYRIDTLYHQQEESIHEAFINQPDYSMSSPVKLESYRGNRVIEVGEGILTLNRESYLFEGIVDGQQTTYRFSPKNIITLPSDLGRNIQIYEGYVIYQFVFSDTRIPTQFVIAGEFLYSLANEKQE